MATYFGFDGLGAAKPANRGGGGFCSAQDSLQCGPIRHRAGRTLMRQADTLLARFPGPVTLMPSRLKLALALALFAVLTVFCVAVLIPKLSSAGGYDAIMTVFSTLVLAALTIRTVILLIRPGTVGLTLTADGFEIGTF